MNILLADDHPLFREGIALLLKERDAAACVLHASSLAETLVILRQDPEMDLLLLDLNMPGMSGLQSVELLRREFSDVPLVILSAMEAPDLVRAMLSKGVAGFIPKSSTPAVMVGAIQLVLGGGTYIPPQGLGDTTSYFRPSVAPVDDPTRLTDKQRQVLALLVLGKPNKLICKELNISEGTVKHHISTIYRVLNVNNRTEAAASARQLGIID